MPHSFTPQREPATRFHRDRRCDPYNPTHIGKFLSVRRTARFTKPCEQELAEGIVEI
jgi:hypothetical protein